MKLKNKIPAIIALAVLGSAIVAAVPALFPKSTTLAQFEADASPRTPPGLTLQEQRDGLTVVQLEREARGFGLQVGDKIIRAAGKEVTSFLEFREVVKKLDAHEELGIVVQRGQGKVFLNSTFPQISLATTNDAVSEPQTGAVLQEVTKVIKSNWADFGIELEERDQQLHVASVTQISGLGSHGVKVGDVLIQVDKQPITALRDFHRIAAEKFVGNTANIAVARGQDVILYHGVKLGAVGETISPSETFAPVVYDTAVLDDDQLTRLLQKPFEFHRTFDSPSVADITPPQAQPLLREQPSGALTYAQTIPESPSGLESVAEVPPIRANLPEDASIDAPHPQQINKPNAIPRFHKYSRVRLPEIEEGWDSSDQRANSIDAVPLVTPPSHRVVGGSESDGEATLMLDTPDNDWSTAEVVLSQVPQAESVASPSDEEVPPPDPIAESAVDLESVPADPPPPPAPDLTIDDPGSVDAEEEVGEEEMPSPAGDDLANTADEESEKVDPVVQSVPYNYMPAQPIPMCYVCGGWGPGSCTCGRHGAGSVLGCMKECVSSVDVGGWASIGYHSASNDLFNNRPDTVNLHQGWVYLEREADCNNPLGFRADLMYGIDGTDTQAFGNNLGRWDFGNGFDYGAYSWALPQLYAEVAVGDWSIKLGHFFTLIGYETVTAPDNFFYSHAMTMYNSEPFTHTGVVASRELNDCLEVFAGWTLGWDSGFDQFNGGSNWLGGAKLQLSPGVSLNYMSTAGNFGWRGEDAYSHSIVLNTQLTQDLAWIGQSDYLRVGSTGEDNVGINQYLLYTPTDTLGLGARIEWWKGDVLTGYAPHGGVLPSSGSLSYYSATAGINYRPHEQLTVRPEVRHDWSPAANYEETYFGIDAILTY